MSPQESEATRLLCAGTYLDDDFRDAVIDELYLHEERVVAPSAGIDTARVLAHALRARRIQAGWALVVVLLILPALWLTDALMILFLVSCLLLVWAVRLEGGSPGPFRPEHPEGHAGDLPWYQRVPARYLRLAGRLGVLQYVLLAVAGAFGQDGELRGELFPDQGAAWAALFFPLAVAGCVAAHRQQVALVLSGDLHPGGFREPGRPDTAGATSDGRFARVRAMIQREQHSPLILYHAHHPFLGAGTPEESWTLAVELRPAPERVQVPLDNREVLRRIVPWVTSLTTPATAATAATADGGNGEHAPQVRDRLRQLEIDECVFVPVTGVPVRAAAPLGEGQFDAERERAVEEGGEARRHFLRIRVGAWEQEVVTTVFVRVHTQGGMLVLEIAPHVLRPVRQEFHAADRVAEAHLRAGPLGKAAWVLGQVPADTIRSAPRTAHGIAFLWRALVGGQATAPADGPWASVRELGAERTASTFQEMDVSRYLKSVQDRVARGVREALEDAGWQTGDFVQQVVNVSGVYIGSAQNSAIAVGDQIDLENKHITAGDSA